MEREPDMSKTPVGQGDPMSDAVDKLADSASAERHSEPQTAGDIVGESVGGVTGTVAGAAIGALAGPVGAVIGGIAGAIGGWWAGRTVSEAVSSFSEEDDDYFRTTYESADYKLADRPYEDVRPAYQLGYVARRNPDYAGRTFEEIEADLERGWTTTDLRSHAGDWSRVRRMAHDAYNRGHGTESTAKRISEITNAARQKMHDDTTGGGIAP
ncbi:MAG TPA: hypothetical protein VJ672_17095 [Gemmatimonadaceae bacterium]|nr:hypothetical protein [Gemmatimonadaceae bacterium]